MLNKKDVKILKYLRKNSRVNLTKVSKETGIPLSTIYDRVRFYNKNMIVKNTSLIDFSKIGFFSKVYIAISCDRTSKENLLKYLTGHPNVNSLSMTNFGSDFVIEGIFKDPIHVEDFVHKLESSFKINSYKIYNVLKELKREEFLTEESHLEGENGI